MDGASNLHIVGACCITHILSCYQFKHGMAHKPSNKSRLQLIVYDIQRNRDTEY